MREADSAARVHVIEGRPWKDALISIVEPRSPHRPWYAGDGVEPGDVLIAVLDTDPRSVLTQVATVGSDGDINAAIAAIDRWVLNGPLEIGTVNMMTNYVVRPSAGPVSYRAPDEVVGFSGTSCHRPARRCSATPR